nr:glycoside hydrolase family 2 protein [Paenibacillus massiliensis]
MIHNLTAWSFKSADEEQWLPAQVPGCVHTDLLQSGRIDDPFYGTNEHRLQWVDKQDWEYAATLHVDSDWLQLDVLELVFEGLDTYANVYVNGQQVLTADNMFRIWRVDIRAYLTPGENALLVRFRSPIQEDLPKLEKLGYELPAPNDQSELGELGSRKVSVFARKAPFHYGWDWGPRFVTSGIWREVRLEGWSTASLTDFCIRQDEVTAAEAKLTALVEVACTEAVAGQLLVSGAGGEWSMEVNLPPGQHVLELPMDIREPELWWSRGLGEAKLHTFRATLKQGTELLSEHEVRTGLRSVRLVRERDEAGASFYLELNGIPVFCKGANHIPNDSFVTEVTSDRYLHEIRSAVESNMNMLRVWGGGIYEADVFYDLCDEHGILVWQDFMFACSMYPGDERFLHSVKQEAADQLRRLRHHPSIALWCGNNEIDSAWSHYVEERGWGWKQSFTHEQREQLWADYEAVFHQILPDRVQELMPEIPYWPSSPLVDLTGDDRQHTRNDSTEGDIHYWGVWHNSEPFDNYSKYVGRFMSEYGFQSFPDYRTVRTYAEEQELALESEVMLAHQKNGRGNQLIKTYMDRYMQESRDFVSFMHMSQILQADAMGMAIEAHRRRKPYCMGTLYWQMNDCWPVASWASMDYYGRWKAAQYTIKRSFKDIMLSIELLTEDSEQAEDQHRNIISIHLINDTLEPLEGTLRVALYHIRDGLVEERTQSVEIPKLGATVASTLSIHELLQGRGAVEYVLVAALEQDGTVLDRREQLLAPLQSTLLPAPKITVRELAGLFDPSDQPDKASLFTHAAKISSTWWADDDVHWFSVQSDVLAKYVWLSAEVDGMFTDNNFDLLPGETKLIGFRPRAVPQGYSVDKGQGQKQEQGQKQATVQEGQMPKLTVYSLNDLIQPVHSIK